MSTGDTGALGRGESGPSTQQGRGRAGRAIAKGGNRPAGGSGSHREAANAQSPCSRTGERQARSGSGTAGRFQGQLCRWASRPGTRALLQIQMLRSERWRGWAPDPLSALLLELLGFRTSRQPPSGGPWFFQGPKGKQGKAGAPGRRGIQVSGPQPLLSHPPPFPPQKPSKASCVPPGPAGAAGAPGRGGETGP